MVPPPAVSDERDTGTVPAAPSHQPGVARGDRVHSFATPGITVTWSRSRCTHVAECVFALPTVFEPGRRPWVDATQATADAVARAVQRCPTGALHFERTDGGPAEAPAEVNSVRVTKLGPTHLRGRIEVLDDTGQVILCDSRAAICRCGKSSTKPLCDNTHSAIGFRDAAEVRDESDVKDPGAPDATLRVTPQADGPLVITGPFTLRGTGAGPTLTGTKVTLCRCGQSSNKPFCDGSHERVGFQSAQTAAPDVGA